MDIDFASEGLTFLGFWISLVSKLFSLGCAPSLGPGGGGTWLTSVFPDVTEVLKSPVGEVFGGTGGGAIPRVGNAEKFIALNF